MPRRTIEPSLAVLLALLLAGPVPAAVRVERVTVEMIMADPDWIGRAPERPYWSDDGRRVYFRQKREGAPHRDLLVIDLEGGTPRVLSDAEAAAADQPGGAYSSDRSAQVYARAGDLYVKDLAAGTVRQLTRTRASESRPSFMAGDRRIQFQREGVLLVRELETGLEYEPADVRSEDDPDEKKERKDEPYLTAQQERLFEIVRRRKERRESGRARSRDAHDADAARLARPWYLGAKVQILDRVLSPAGDVLVLRIADGRRTTGKRDTMPAFVTEDGYVSTRSVRAKVGTDEPRGERLVLLDLESRERHDIDLGVLPGIDEDPLEVLSEGKDDRADEAPPEEPAAADPEADTGADADADADRAAPAAAADEKKRKPRPVSIRSVTFTRDGAHVAVQCFSLDRKDRWIARLDLATRALVPVAHRRDDAWINPRFSRLGWLPDDRTLWFRSEETGYAHLYVHDAVDGGVRPLTSGPWEVTSVVPDRAGAFFYITGNRTHPGVYEVARVEARSGRLQPLTRLGGMTRFVLSPDERHLLLTHSRATRPPELYVQRNEPGSPARRLTETVSAAFTAMPWVAPRVVEVPSRAGRPIYARLYLPAPTGTLRPAVLFVHGAGYLQNAHLGWSRYSREFMFHTLLARRGYVVLDMDYRASAGYGRDWRTAIHRRMGEPELEDLEDGVRWLAREHDVDPDAVGVYGGSYGGFLTLMALFRKPELFACGAALRPVTDWAHYNDFYTSNILHTPDLDPAAYERSSPIGFAEGLARPLLICHGMVDDNVLFQDTVRLVQRLIELGKEDWEVAIYPVEGHGFREPESWLDEYRRILKLFETNLRSGTGRPAEAQRSGVSLSAAAAGARTPTPLRRERDAPRLR